MSDILQTLGKASKFIDFNGRNLSVPPMNYLSIGKLENWLEQRAFAAVERSKKVLGIAEYREAVGAVSRDVAAGTYAFGSSTFSTALKSLAGLKQMLLVKLLQDEQEVSAADVDAIFDDHVKRDALVDLVTAMSEGDDLPNVKTVSTESK